jgi:hypothetical protein
MIQEDKEQLLLKDLCAKQSWGVKVQYNNKVYAIDYVSTEYKEVKLDILDNYTVGISDIKPYLRSMSSMTKEEKKEISVLLNYEFYIDDDYALVAEDDRHRIRLDLIQIYIDWLDANKFDYRDLIPMGLAIEVTKENNPYKEIEL